METTVNERIMLIKAKHNYGTNEFAQKAGISPATVSSIENGGNVSLKTLRIIATSFNLNPDWLRTGKGKTMMEVVEPVNETPWKDEAYTRLKADMDYLKEQYSKVLNRLLDGGNLGKYKALKYAERFEQAA